MSEVWIDAGEAERGSVPTRCAKRGERCINRVRLHSADLPAALEWSTWTGLWPRNRGRPTHPIVVSLLPRVATTQRILARLRDITAVLVLVLGGIALVADGTAGRVALRAALATLAVKVVVAVIGMLWAVDVTHDVTGEWVLVRGVHPDFVAAGEAVLTRPDEPPRRREVSTAVAMTKATAPDRS